MTSLDMNGIQVSILSLANDASGVMCRRLRAAAAPRAWPAAVEINTPELVPMPLRPPPAAETNPRTYWLVEAFIRGACRALMEARSELNDLDSKVGDGDCGNTMHTGAESVLKMLPGVSTASPKLLCAALGRTLNSL